MGLFDDVKVEFPLPDPAYQDLDFQTKDFDCEMDTYLITADGKLIRNTAKVQLKNDEYVPIGGNISEVDFHGDFNFYTSLENQDLKWLEYKARFTEGVCQWIRRVG